MTAVGLLVVCTNASWAQQANSQAGATGAEPVMSPLTGAELFTPGFEGAPAGSYLLPSLEWTAYGNTNPNVSAGQSKIVATGYRCWESLPAECWETHPVKPGLRGRRLFL